MSTFPPGASSVISECLEPELGAADYACHPLLKGYCGPLGGFLLEYIYWVSGESNCFCEIARAPIPPFVMDEDFYFSTHKSDGLVISSIPLFELSKSFESASSPPFSVYSGFSSFCPSCPSSETGAFGLSEWNSIHCAMWPILAFNLN